MQMYDRVHFQNLPFKTTCNHAVNKQHFRGKRISSQNNFQMILKCNLSSCFAASYGPNPICKGCLSCSKDNGCIRCQHKLFFFLRREGMRQYGECLHSCPSGYYGLRTPDMNRCSSEFFVTFAFTFIGRPEFILIF